MPESPPNTPTRPTTPTNQGTEVSREMAGRGVMRRRRQSRQEDNERNRRRSIGRVLFGNGEGKQPDRGKLPLSDSALKY